DDPIANFNVPPNVRIANCGVALEGHCRHQRQQDERASSCSARNLRSPRNSCIMLIGQGRPARVPVLVSGHPASSPGNQNILPQRRLIGLGAGRNVRMLFRARLLLRIDISGQSFPVTVTPPGPNDSLYKLVAAAIAPYTAVVSLAFSDR